MHASRSPTVVIAGAGDVGGRLARLRAARGETVLALRRRPAQLGQGIHSLGADLVSGEGFATLPRRADALVFCAAPDRRDERTYRDLFVSGLRRLIETVDSARLVFVSSTAVYAEAHGGWVDETTPADPTAFNGLVLREAEALVHAQPGGVVLRLSGLYGPGRTTLLRRALAGTPGRPHWTNRIHVDDAASALSHLLELRDPQRLYCGTDDMPVLEQDVLAWMRERDGLPPVAAEGAPVSGRRVSNVRLRGSGWTPRYPDYRIGYAAGPAPSAGA